jgi:hypothetical protein
MRQLDKFEQIAADAQIVAIILGNLETRDYELVDPSHVPLAPETAAALHARNLGFIGTVGVVAGKFESAFAVPVDDATAATLAQTFLAFVVAKFTPSRSSDYAVDWLRNLYSLPDNRKRNEEN